MNVDRQLSAYSSSNSDSDDEEHEKVVDEEVQAI